MMEGFTFVARKPRRGDIVVFKSDGIASLPAGEVYVKRIAGQPGEHVRIAEGKLFINERLVALSNASGEITYSLPPGSEGMSPITEIIVPAGQYFLLGDNSTNSSDSRFWGPLPGRNVIGRIWFCYWPANRIGGLR